MKGMFKTNTFYNVGFTGSRNGTTEWQRISLRKVFGHLILSFNKIRFHNGVCKGSDEDSWIIARDLNFRLVAHPPVNSALIFDHSSAAHEIRKPLSYLKRNMQIIVESSALVATPDSVEEKLRSGTWATVRYARIAEIPIALIWPNGSVRWENEKGLFNVKSEQT